MCVVVVASVHRWNCLRRLAHHPQPLRLDASCLRGVGKCKKDREARGFTGPHSLDAPPLPAGCCDIPGSVGRVCGVRSLEKEKTIVAVGSRSDGAEKSD
jgi:hypothetical protein